MTFQPALPGISPPPAATDKLLFAVMPDARAAQKIAALTLSLRSLHGLKGNLIDATQLHVSIFQYARLTNLSDKDIRGAMAIANRIILERFKTRFDVAKGFRNQSGISNQYPFALCQSQPCDDFANLHQGFTSFFRERNVMVPNTMTPHVTMLYSDTLAPTLPVDPIEWTVEEFVLLRRQIGRHLPYSVLGRWPLY
jgi:2'-5' RNA ligase